MQKVLAIMTINPDFVQFAIPQLKTLLQPLGIPQDTLFSDSAPLPTQHYNINYKNVRNFPYVTLNIPDFEKHRSFFEYTSQRAVMISKFVLLLSSGHNYEQLFEKKNEELLEKECRNWNDQILCDFVTRNRIIDRPEQIKKIHDVFGKFDIRGKVDFKNATKRLQLVQLHKWYQMHHEVPSQQTLQRVYFGIELSASAQSNKAKFNSKYQLSNRIYLGPTSADNDLAFLMCNQAKVQQGSLVFDPFVGTAGLLIPPASRGAIVFGCDLDMRVLNGYSVGRINKKSTYYSVDKNLETFTPKINLSFDQYELPRPNILRMDCTKCSFAPHTLFDAIITDPPYGIRAMSRSTQKKQKGENTKEQLLESGECKVEEINETKDENKQKGQTLGQAKITQITDKIQNIGLTTENKESVTEKTQEELKQQQMKRNRKQMRKQNKKKRKQMMTEEEKQLKNQITQKLNRQRIDNWNKFDKLVIENTEKLIIFEGLLKVARRHLRVGGRLVFLYPVYEQEEFIGVESLPACEGFEVIDFSQNMMAKGNSRILVTLQKL